MLPVKGWVTIFQMFKLGQLAVIQLLVLAVEGALDVDFDLGRPSLQYMLSVLTLEG